MKTWKNKNAEYALAGTGQLKVFTTIELMHMLLFLLERWLNCSLLWLAGIAWLSVWLRSSVPPGQAQESFACIPTERIHAGDWPRSKQNMEIEQDALWLAPIRQEFVRSGMNMAAQIQFSHTWELRHLHDAGSTRFAGRCWWHNSPQSVQRRWPWIHWQLSSMGNSW